MPITVSSLTACGSPEPDAGKQRIEILDLLHVTPRLWAAAKLLLGAKSKAVLPFVRQRVTQILQGKVVSVIAALRRLAKEHGLKAGERTKLGRICGYLHKHRARMRYDDYHLIKDRMERAGMHWTMAGAQAMLDLRSVWIGGYWERFQQERIERETERLYPHRDLVAGEAYFSTAA